MRCPLVLLLVVCLPFLVFAQGDSIPLHRLTSHSWMVGAGRTNRLDTYLSPLEYTGPELRVMRETMRPTRWLDGRLSTQTLVVGGAAYTHSPTDNGKAWCGQIDASFGYHYNWTPLPGLRLLAGAHLAGGIGFQYNTRNGNNPAQARVDIALEASVAAIYRFKLKEKWFSARLQLDAPVVGAMFTPNYGQSYYELFSLGHYDHNVRFTYPGNAPTMRGLLTLDIPVATAVLRMGYLVDIRQSNVNYLKRHAWTHAFMIGCVKHFSIIRAGDSRRDNMIY